MRYEADFPAVEEERREQPAPPKRERMVEVPAPGPTDTVRKDDFPPQPVEEENTGVSAMPDTLSPDVHASDTPPIQSPKDRDDWDPYGFGTPVAQQAPAPVPAPGPAPDAVDDVFNLLHVLREHESSTASGQDAVQYQIQQQPMSPFKEYEAATPGGYRRELAETIEVEEMEVKQHGGTVEQEFLTHVHHSVQVKQQVQIEPAPIEPPTPPSQSVELPKIGRHWRTSPPKKVSTINNCSPSHGHQLGQQNDAKKLDAQLPSTRIELATSS